MINSFIHRITSTYRFAIIFVASAFIAVLIPIIAEGVQHIAEVKFGMFTPAGGLTGPEKNARLILGLFKVLSIVSISLILPRYFIHNQQIRWAFALSAKARRVLYIMAGVIIAYVCLALFGGPLAIEFLESKGMVFPAKLKPVLPIIVLAVIMMPLQYKFIGSIAALFDDAPMSKLETSRLNKLMSGGAVPSLLFAFVPAMMLHYFLNSFAMGKTGLLLFSVLAFDSILVGFMAVLVAAATYVVYKEARQ